VLHTANRGDMAADEDVLALLAWAAPDLLCDALERELAAQPARADALSASERMRRVAELLQSFYPGPDAGRASSRRFIPHGRRARTSR